MTTTTGENRARYAESHKETDPRPSRFGNGGEDYKAWAARADAHAIPTDFWAQIDHQLGRIAAEKPDTFAAVREILTDWGYDEIVKDATLYGARPEHLPASDPSHNPRAAFFAGSGGDETILSALRAAGWRVVWMEASYYYVAKHPQTGEILTYIEGDVLAGNRAGVEL